jgi:heat shock protein HslJ
MTSRRSFVRPLRPHPVASSRSGKVSALLLSVWVVFGCSSEPDEKIEPLAPVFLGERVRFATTLTGVAVVGEAGAVSSSARVDVVNASTGQEVTADAASDGSFELELGGTPMDEFRLYATLGEQTTRAISIFGFTSDGYLALADLEFSSVAAEGFTLAADTKILLTFGHPSHLSFDAGCNTHSASYWSCDGRLCVSDLGATAIACDSALQSQDQWLAAYFASSPRLTRQGPRLSLSSDEASFQFMERSLLEPDRPLTGRTWTIDTIIAGDQARSVPLAPTLSFLINGTVQVFTTCTTGVGFYAAVDQRLTFFQVEYIEKPCDAAGDASIDESIRRMLGDGTVDFAIDRERMTITLGSDGLQAGTD